MDKKDYLLKLLALLETDDLVIMWLRVLVEQGEITEDILDSFIETFQNYAKTLKKEEEKEKMQKAIQFVEQMKSIEQKSLEKDQTRLSELDNLLASI